MVLAGVRVRMPAMQLLARSAALALIRAAERSGPVETLPAMQVEKVAARTAGPRLPFIYVQETAERLRRRKEEWRGSPTGPRSSTWRFWGNKKGDFYVSVRPLGGIVKTSFHRDGRCHTGLTGTYAESIGRAAERHWDRWDLPADAATRALEIADDCGSVRFANVSLIAFAAELRR